MNRSAGGTCSSRSADGGCPDVIVVGSGPAGSTLSILLARRGWRVTMLERASHPRPKACGECVNPGAVAVLDRLGLLESVLALGPARLDGWRLETTEGPLVHAGFGGAAGLGIARADLDAALARAAVRAGVRLEERVHVREVVLPGRRTPAVGSAARIGGSPGATTTPDHPTLHTRVADGHRKVRSARLVVGADGLRSVVARALGRPVAPPHVRKVSLTFRLCGDGPERTRGLLRLGPRGTLGLAPVHDELPLWNGTVVVDGARWGRALAGRSEAFFMEALAESGVDWTSGPVLVDGPWASGPFDVPRRRVVDHGVLLVGDAAGYYDPLTGQGIYRALTSAELAAPVIDRALMASRGAPTRASLIPYEIGLRHAFRASRRLQRVIEAVVSSSRLRPFAFSRLARAPGFADALVRVTGDAAPTRTLLRPSLWAEVLRQAGPWRAGRPSYPAAPR